MKYLNLIIYRRWNTYDEGARAMKKVQWFWFKPKYFRQFRNSWIEISKEFFEGHPWLRGL